MMISVPMTKSVTMVVPNGEMYIEKKGDTYHLEYHNPIYKNSPFKVPTNFSTQFTVTQIMNSGEVARFMSRFK